MYKLFALLLVFLLACDSQKTVNSLESYNNYIIKNDMIAEESYEDLKVTVKYLPADYLALLEYNKSNEMQSVGWDSAYVALKKDYENTYAFQLLFESSKGEPLAPFIHRSARGEEDYSKQVQELNFRMEQHLMLRNGETLTKPVLVRMESTAYDKQLSFIVNFEKNEKLMEGKEVLFLLKDLFFMPGVHQLKLNPEALKKTPQIKLK